ncbi:glycosyltransferase [Cellulomonas fimi]|uniref:Glycosyltransferase n=1 Tax=Cellulomonas fimi TaxID=1708 RepID=A0A7Y0M1T1_CELFI|nr:glycosyltransferase [Cellulomonas fimi]NMR20872.1 glycosyltransferase [Cellulomonas fimi]
MTAQPAAEFHVSSVVRGSDVAAALVLARTVLDVHPETTVTLLDVDTALPAETKSSRIRVVGLHELGLAPDELHRKALYLDDTAFRAWLRPRLLQHLLGTRDVVVLLDPGFRVVGRLDALVQRALAEGTTAQPRAPHPVPDDGRTPSPDDAARAGALDDGVVAAARAGREVLSRWAQRCSRDTAAVPWLDQLLPVTQPAPLRVVSAWTVGPGTELTATYGGITADGAPVQLVDLRGFDPDRPWVIDPARAGVPRALLSEHPVLAEICADHGAELLARRASACPGAFRRIAAGPLVTPALRAAYRTGIDAAAVGSEMAPPDPFDPDTAAAFRAWLAEPALGRPGGEVSRYLAGVRSVRRDLQQAFPDVPGRDSPALLAWADRHGRHEEGIDAGLLDASLAAAGSRESHHASIDLGRRAVRGVRGVLGRAVRSAVSRRAGGVGDDAAHAGAAGPDWAGDAASETESADAAQRSRLTPGLNVVGYLRGELGVGESARLVIRALDAVDVPHRDVAVSRHVQSRQDATFTAIVGDRTFDTTLVCVNADLVADAVEHLPADVRAGYRIGMWYWEVEEFPASMHPAFGVVDEVWSATDFIRDALAPHTTKPVVTMTPPMPSPRPRPDATRDSLGLPEGFVFLFSFDHLSTLERKNPLGLIDAFRRSFAPGEGPSLVIKTINADRRIPDAERLRLRAAREPDVMLMEGYLDAGDRDALTALADCYISLHRAEGLGLSMAEAMALGKPVIATRYSGNLQFMDEDNSFLVPWSPVTIPADAEPYPLGGRWADPDLDAAAALMRQVVDAPALAARRGAQAAEDIAVRHSAETAGRAIATRLEEIRRTAAPA